MRIVVASKIRNLGKEVVEFGLGGRSKNTPLTIVMNGAIWIRTFELSPLGVVFTNYQVHYTHKLTAGECCFPHEKCVWESMLPRQYHRLMRVRY